MAFVQEKEVGWEVLGQENRIPFAGAKHSRRMLQREIRRRTWNCHLDPGRPEYLLRARKAPAVHCHLMMHFRWDQNSVKERFQNVELAYACERN